MYICIYVYGRLNSFSFGFVSGLLRPSRHATSKSGSSLRALKVTLGATAFEW